MRRDRLAVTTTWFGDDCHELRGGYERRIKLIDGNILTRLIKKHKGLDVPIGMDRSKLGVNSRSA